jgi:hypothetical protein
LKHLLRVLKWISHKGELECIYTVEHY